MKPSLAIGGRSTLIPLYPALLKRVTMRKVSAQHIASINRTIRNPQRFIETLVKANIDRDEIIARLMDEYEMTAVEASGCLSFVVQKMNPYREYLKNPILSKDG